ncbi:PRC-barrel domain-containing protein [Halomonas urumqiensis]|uniref:PRC-barrel domain-containing protein n=1 Tax=Halomonas urumqiensis TaxID=1684789 RepID=UPI0019C16530|nr:PRC-barrel domain-containing protein [Halomonas urumqiensis]GHE20874.1 hypothetical protein GCM10017767_13950 [Halomonas urumqiensis]
MTKMTTPLALTIAALAAGISASAMAENHGHQPQGHQPQGLYSAEDIIDADVYLSANPEEEVGEVEDILLDEGMGVAALVIESGSVLNLGGQEFIVKAGQFSLTTYQDDDGDTEHRVMLDASADEIEGYPVYDNDWWQQARERSREAWMETQEGAQSAWETTQEGAESAWETTRENAQRAWNSALDAMSTDGN